MSVEAPIITKEKKPSKPSRKNSVWIPESGGDGLACKKVIIELSGNTFYSQTCFIGFELPNPKLCYHPFKFFWWENVPNNPGKLKEYLFRLRQDLDALAAIGPAVDRLKTYREKRASVIRRENGQNVIGIYLEERNRLRVGSLPRF